MDIANRETYGLLAVVLLLLKRQYPVDLAIQNFILRRMRRRRLRVRFLQSLQMLYFFYRNRRLQVARRPRRAWIFPRPQNWFQELLNNRALDHERSRKIEGFSEKSKVPNVVAAIDGSHIPIKAPKENHEDYFNRKHFYSYLVQGIVDSSGLFLSVVTGFPGSLHDSRMLRLSDVYWAAENEDILMEPTLDLRGTVIRPLVVGDSAYPLKTWLLPVIKDNGALNRDQKKFNKELSKARIVSEHAFGLLKGRWRALLKRLDEDHWRTPNTIIACCVLHNICIIRGDEFDGDLDDDSDDDDDDDHGVPSQAASGVRRAVIEFVANQ